MKEQNRKGPQDDNQDQDFPGYPHYPSNEDITRVDNNNGKVNISNDSDSILLPDLKDIPGQEHVRPAPLGELADTTISSADEEDVLNGDSLDAENKDDEDIEIVMGTEADVTPEDLRMLSGDSPTAELDNVDEDGEPLNEEIDSTVNPGASLDIPGSEDDDSNEAIGEEDEENNYYSLGGDKDESGDVEPSL